MRDGLSPVLLGQLVVLVALCGFVYGVVTSDAAVMTGCGGLMVSMGGLGAYRWLARTPDPAQPTPPGGST